MGSGRLEELLAAVGATGLVVTDHERVLLEAGDVAAPVHCRSIRKRLLGAPFARPVLSGLIGLDATLGQLGIDDAVPPSLSEGERSARVRDLLTCRSGVYHLANHAGPDGGASALPPRGSRRPGELFVYSNWDFNALGAILERAAGRSMFQEFADVIAGPAGLQDYAAAAQRYATQQWSEHRTYAFHVSTRDLASFGRLYLNEGRGGDGEVIPAAWVAESTQPHARTGRGPGGAGPAFGYLWWVAVDGGLFAGTTVPDGSFAAYGMGSQFLLVVPALDRAVALLADPTRPGGLARDAHRSKLAEAVHVATDGAIPLVSSAQPASETASAMSTSRTRPTRSASS